MTKILIVDDDADVVDVCRVFLENEGFSVETASNKKDGMIAVKKFKPDLIILDVMMEAPDDGITMARDLRSSQFKTPIIMLTGLGQVTGMQFDKDDDIIPVDTFFEKPIDARTLIAKIRELLGE